MKWSEHARDEVLRALARVLPDQRLRPCSFCGATEWLLSDAFVGISASSEFFGYPVEEAKSSYASLDMIFPFVAMSCMRCGNTHFLNLRLLGLDHLVRGPDEIVPPTPRLMPK